MAARTNNVKEGTGSANEAFSKAIYYMMAGAIVLMASTFITVSYLISESKAQATASVQRIDEWNQARSSSYEAIERIEYSIRRINEQEFETPNREQDLYFRFDARGFSLSPRSNGKDWYMRFQLDGIGRDGGWLLPEELPEMTVDGGELRVDHGSFTMRYTNDRRGMRQDFLVHERLSGGSALEVHLDLEGPLVARNDGPDAIEFLRPDEQPGEDEVRFRYHGLMAWDAIGRMLPTQMWAIADDLVIMVDDHDAVYPITIDPLSSTPDATLEMNTAGAAFGSSVATAGDVNGDGFSDLLVGAPDFGLMSGGEGAAFLFLGSSAGISATPAWTWIGDQAGAHAGYSVATAGDVNGDGFSDVLVGSPDRSNGQANEGRALLFLGSASGLSAVPSWSVESNQIGARLGASIATAGDVNGDGFSDILVGAPGFDSGQIDEGAVFIFHGSASGPASTPTLMLQRDQAGAAFGSAVSAAGDVNGDGYSDVVIGAPLYDNTVTDEGGIFIHHGSATGVGLVPNTTRFRAVAGAQMGYSVSFAGDVNGDGYSDVLAGLPFFSGTLSQQGQALLYRGSATGIAASPSWSHNGGQANANAGSSVAGLGDLNGDGYSDVAIGLPHFSNGQATEGLARVFKGTPTASGLSLTASWAYEGQQIGAELGTKVAPAGDVNGDGLADLVVGVPFRDNGETDEGAAMIFHGRTAVPTATASWTIEGGLVDAAFGECVSSAGDVNGDGFSDVLVGAPMYSNGQLHEGRAMLYMGSATGLSTTPAWTAEGDQADARFGFSVRSAGDVNGDGYSDVIVGSPYYSNGQTQEGRAFLYLGSPAGLSALPAWTFESGQANARLGWSVSSAGDVNGDGYSDVIVGAYLYTSTLTAEGRCYVFHGSATGLSATPDWTMDGGQLNGFFGISVGVAGDVNGDGHDDVIIGATLYDNAFSTEGAAFVVHGSPAGLLNTTAWPTFGGSGSPQLGNIAGYAGDVNGDGYSDVFVAASRASNGQTNEGFVRIYHGAPGGLPALPATILENDQDNAQFGNGAAYAGDVNGDGYGDLIVGAPFASWFYVNEGRAFVYLGGPSGLSAPAAWNISGGQANAQHGTSVSGAGDVNGDGFSDVLIGTPAFSNGQSNEGRVTMHYGNGGAGITRRTRQYRSDLSTPVQTSNNTFDPGCAWGIGQFARSPLGRTRLRLAIEVKGHGPPYSGNPITSGMGITTESAAWTSSGLTGLELTQSLVTAPGTSSHPTWRARVRSHPATSINGQMLGPWYHSGIHDAQVPSLKVELAACGPLPIELAEFTADCIDHKVGLQWSTFSESHIDRFQVSHSRNGSDWKLAGTVDAIGNEYTTSYYSWIDQANDPDRKYYRLETISTSNEHVVEGILSAPECMTDRMELQLFPNPAAGGSIRITWQGADGHVLKIHDAMGRFISQVVCSSEGERTMANVDTGNLPSGTYLARLFDRSGQQLAQAKFVVLDAIDR